MENHKKTGGRKKIEIKKIENNNNRLISFSKRRFGIYKKASELVALTGAEIIVGGFSPSGRAYAFGHPSMEAVEKRFLGQELALNNFTQAIVDPHQSLRIQELSQQYNEVADRLDLEKQRSKELEQKLKGKHTPDWWTANVEELDIEQLLQMSTNLKVAENKLWKSLGINEGASTSNPIITDP